MCTQQSPIVRGNASAARSTRQSRRHIVCNPLSPALHREGNAPGPARCSALAACDDIEESRMKVRNTQESCQRRLQWPGQRGLLRGRGLHPVYTYAFCSCCYVPCTYVIHPRPEISVKLYTGILREHSSRQASAMLNCIRETFASFCVIFFCFSSLGFVYLGTSAQRNRKATLRL